MLYSRAYSRLVGFGMLMLNADKGGGTSGSQKPPTVTELAQKVKDLEAQNARLSEEKAEAVKNQGLAEAAQKKAEGERAEANNARDAAISAQQKAEKDLADANQAKATLETEKATVVKERDQAKTDLQSTRTELQDATGRLEIAAKNGATLPPKGAGAGDHTVTEKPEDQSGTPAQRLAATIKLA